MIDVGERHGGYGEKHARQGFEAAAAEEIQAISK